MSAFVHRIQLAEICREVVDTMPSILLEPQELEYDVVLALDAKFQGFIKALPVFFQLDPASIQQSQKVCTERPYIAWQRTSLHFSINTRICRLHRPFHVEGSTNPKYAFSRMMCIRSAQTVLDLRRSMDDIGPLVGLKPSRFRTVMQHVFLAAIILATDASFNPSASDAEIRKTEVLTACKMLDKSQQESTTWIEGIQRGVQTLMSMLQKKRSRLSTSQPKGSTGMSNASSYVAPSEMVSIGQQPSRELGDSSRAEADRVERAVSTPSFPSTANLTSSSSACDDGAWSSSLTSEVGPGEENWGHLWSEFFNAAPELDVPEWTSLLDDMEFTLGLDF
jgi:hypothetical protein